MNRRSLMMMLGLSPVAAPAVMASAGADVAKSGRAVMAASALGQVQGPPTDTFVDNLKRRISDVGNDDWQAEFNEGLQYNNLDRRIDSDLAAMKSVSASFVVTRQRDRLMQRKIQHERNERIRQLEREVGVDGVRRFLQTLGGK